MQAFGPGNVSCKTLWRQLLEADAAFFVPRQLLEAGAAFFHSAPASGSRRRCLWWRLRPPSHWCSVDGLMWLERPHCYGVQRESYISVRGASCDEVPTKRAWPSHCALRSQDRVAIDAAARLLVCAVNMQLCRAQMPVAFGLLMRTRDSAASSIRLTRRHGKQIRLYRATWCTIGRVLRLSVSRLGTLLGGSPSNLLIRFIQRPLRTYRSEWRPDDGHLHFFSRRCGTIYTGQIFRLRYINNFRLPFPIISLDTNVSKLGNPS